MAASSYAVKLHLGGRVDPEKKILLQRKAPREVPSLIGPIWSKKDHWNPFFLDHLEDMR